MAVMSGTQKNANRPNTRHIDKGQVSASKGANIGTATYFRLGHGTQQGSLLSPLLVCLAIEPLAVAIHKDPDIHGITTGGYTFNFCFMLMIL